MRFEGLLSFRAAKVDARLGAIGGKDANPSFGIATPTPACIAASRDCSSASGISPSAYKTLRGLGAAQRRRGAPLATARPIERPSQLLPIPRGA